MTAIHNNRRWITLVLCMVMVLSMLSGCSSADQTKQEKKTEITFSYLPSGEVIEVLWHLNEKFPEYHFKFIQGRNIREGSEYENGLLCYQSEHNAVADIVLDSTLNKNLSHLTATFADLSGKSYSANYQTSYLNEASVDGSVYYFPLYLVVKGIICNKSLFEEKGWKIPTNYEEYSRVLTQISESQDGISPLYDEDNQKTASYLISYGYSLNEGATPAGYEALQAFNDGDSIDALKLDSTLAYMRQLVATGSLEEGEFKNSGGMKTRRDASYYSLLTRQAAMAFASGATWNILKARNPQDELVMIPVFSKECPDGYMLEKKAINIGVSKKAMADPIKAKAIDTIMEYIASEEGQLKILELSSGVKSPCYGIMDRTSTESMQAVLDALENGRILQMMAFDEIDEIVDSTLMEYLFHNEDGHLSDQDILESIRLSRARNASKATQENAPTATVAADFTLEETKYLFLRAMAQQAKTDFALLPQIAALNVNGIPSKSESVLERIFSGNLTEKNLVSIIQHNTQLLVYELTGAQLLEIMDYNTATNMLYGATLQYTYNKDKETYYTTGAILPDGTALDMNKTYTLAATNHAQLPSDLTAAEQSFTLLDAVTAYCAQQSTLTPVSPEQSEYIK